MNLGWKDRRYVLTSKQKIAVDVSTTRMFYWHWSPINSLSQRNAQVGVVVFDNLCQLTKMLAFSGGRIEEWSRVHLGCPQMEWRERS